MAVVRMTEELNGKIKTKAREAFMERIQRAEARGKAYRLNHNMFQVVVDAWIEERGLTEMVKSLPIEFFIKKYFINVAKINGLELSTKRVISDDKENSRDVLCAMISPSNTIDYNAPKIELNHPSLQHFADHAKSITEEIAAIQEERETFIRTLDRLLTNSRSLKHALDQWPQLIELVPQGTINRMNEVVERKKRDKAEREEAEPINVDTLNMSLVIGKISARAEE